jgi:hypothetical protein
MVETTRLRMLNSNVKESSVAVTAGMDDEGFAKAIENWVLN